MVKTMTTELIEGKTLHEVLEMPMMEARKFMRRAGHRWFGRDRPEDTIKKYEVTITYEYSSQDEKVLDDIAAYSEKEAREIALERLSNDVDNDVDDYWVNRITEKEELEK